MVPQKFMPGQEVILDSESNLPEKRVYKIITASPVHREISWKQKVKSLFSPGVPREVISYLYRCKSSVDMRDFMQEDLATYTRSSKAQQQA